MQAVEVAPVAVGDFRTAPALASVRGKALGVRAGTIRPPGKQDFAAYLGDTVAAQLQGAGKLDPASRLVLTGELLENDIDDGISEARGVVAARFVLTDQGRPVFDKVLKAEDRWPSNFVGAVAFQRALLGYGALPVRLAEQLMADPDFRTAARRR